MRWKRERLVVAALAAGLWTTGCGGGGDEGQGAAPEGDAAPAVATTSGAAPAAGAAATSPATAPAAGAVIQTQEVNGAAGLVAELTEATREDGVLTVKLRLRNGGTADVNKSFETGHGRYELFYVTAENQKYFILKDSEGAPLAPVYLEAQLGPGATTTWWGKFPAPPAGVAEFDFVMPDVPPFENVPITDR
jgi:hypothetical protein